MPRLFRRKGPAPGFNWTDVSTSILRSVINSFFDEGELLISFGATVTNNAFMDTSVSMTLYIDNAPIWYAQAGAFLANNGAVNLAWSGLVPISMGAHVIDVRVLSTIAGPGITSSTDYTILSVIQLPEWDNRLEFYT